MISPKTALKRLSLGLGCVLIVAIPSRASAQGGFGPDPYRPYNNQYDAFIYPTAPGSGDVVPNGAALTRRRANQFEDYLRGSGIGTSTYRSQKQLDAKSSDLEQYRPNRTVDRESGFYEKQDAVNEAYFAYLRARDPKKRSQLLRDYQRLQRQPSREFVSKRERDGKAGPADDKTADGARGRSDGSASSTRGAARSGRAQAPPISRDRANDASTRASKDKTPSEGVSEKQSRGNVGTNPSSILEESERREREQKKPRSSGTASARPNLPPPPPISSEPR